MTPRRVAAFAQTLALILIFAPGLQLLGASSVQAAIAPAEPRAGTVLDAIGNGIGCQAGTRKFKGPRDPKNPPWPPGARPTPSPTPLATAIPSALPSTEPSTPEPGASAEQTANGPTMLLASNEVPVAQAEPAAAHDDGADADITPDATTAPGASEKARKSKFILGIDVSHHNGDIDFDKVREAGNRFVFIKATQDTEFVDPRFLTNMERARAAGLAAGGYHFFDYTLDGKAQADHFIDRLELGEAINDALPPVVDVECWAPIGSSTQVVAEARLRDFVARVYERTGRLPLLYTSVFMWKQVMGNAEGFERLPMWAACWGCAAPPSLAPGWDEWMFWQTGVNRVPGVGRLDGNYFSGSMKDLRALKLRPFAIEDGDVATRKQRVELDLGGRDARQMRTSPDGQQWGAWKPVRSRVRAELAREEGEQTLYVQLRAGPGLKSPVISDSIMVDRTGPELSDVVVALREDGIGSGPASIPVVVTWSARDAVAGLSDATVSVKCGEGQVQRS
ncbi:MAG: GH25 family lysozyme, partial [Chloroflexota bacterium]